MCVCHVFNKEFTYLLTRFLILFFPLFSSFWAVRQIKLAISSAFERTLIYTVSYRIARSTRGLCVCLCVGHTGELYKNG